MMASLSTEEPEEQDSPHLDCSIPTDSLQPKVGLAQSDAPVGPSSPVLYQIHHGASNIGKRRATMKRTVRFRYGVLVAGMRTEEHELVLSWSVRPGKRLVTFDGVQVYCIQMKGFGVFDHTVVTPDGRSVRMLACTDPPIGASDDFKTYEIIIDGVSYYDMPTRAADGSPVPVSDRATVDRRRPTTVGEILCPQVYEVANKEIERQDSSPRSAAQLQT